MAYQPTPWQKPALRYTKKTTHPALWMQQRLGKSLVAVATIRRYQPRNGEQLRVLIVAPESALDGWEEALDIFDEHDRVRLTGSRERRFRLLDECHTWTLMNKDGWRSVPEVGGRTHCRRCNGKRKVDGEPCWACRRTGLVLSIYNPRWDAVVWDESFWLKNPQAQITKFFLGNFRDVLHRWSTTGTPNPENDLDFWTQLAWLDGGAFGCRNYWQFRARYFKPTWDRKWQIRNMKYRDMLAQEVSRRAYVMDRATAGMYDVKMKQKRIIELPPKMRKVYDTASKEFLLEAMDGSIKERTLFSGAAWRWLRGITCGFVGDDLVWKGKLKELADLLTGEFAREQVVVWCNYHPELNAVYHWLRDSDISCTRISGRTSSKNRTLRRKRFQKKKVRVLIAMQAAENAGSNFSVADTAIYFSNNPSFVMRTQSEDRLLHFKKKRPIMLIDLVVKSTVDEDVRDLLVDKSWRSQTTFNKALRERLMAGG